MKTFILVFEIQLSNLETLKKELKFDFAEIVYQKSIFDSVNILTLKNYSIIIISDEHGFMRTIGYIKLIKKANPDYRVIILSESNNIDTDVYLPFGADSYFPSKNIEQIKARINLLYLNLKERGEILNWSECTQKTINYIKIYFNKLDDRFLDIISSSINYSTSSISHNVKKDTGKSAKDWLAEIRIDRAKEMLRITDYPVKTIGKTVGYKSEQGFIKSMKRITGMTPSEYREKYGHK